MPNRKSEIKGVCTRSKTSEMKFSCVHVRLHFESSLGVGGGTSPRPKEVGMHIPGYFGCPVWGRVMAPPEIWIISKCSRSVLIIMKNPKSFLIFFFSQSRGFPTRVPWMSFPEIGLTAFFESGALLDCPLLNKLTVSFLKSDQHFLFA